MIWFTELSETCLTWLWHSGWQAAVVALVVWAVLIIGRRKLSSQLKYALLLIVLVKFATPPFLHLQTGLFSQSWFNKVSRTAVVVDLDRQVSAVAVAPTAATDSANDAVTNAGRPSTDHASVLPAETAEQLSTAAPSPENARLASAKSTGSLCLIAAYLAGVAFCIVRLSIRYWSVRRIVSRSFPLGIARSCTGFQPVTQETQAVSAGSLCNISDDAVQELLSQTVQELKMIRTPDLRLSDEIDGPFVIGVFNPVIVMPRQLTQQLTAEQLRIVLAHELIHVRRMDLLVGWVEITLLTIWWFHPAMWWLDRSLRQAREDCCDDVLIAKQLAQPERYCETLIQAAANSTSPALESLEPLALGFSNREHPAGRRIRRLMDDSIFRADRIRISAVVVALLLALVALPGMRQAQERQPVTSVNLRGMFGWKNLPFTIDADTEAAVNECRTIAARIRHTRGKESVFEKLETRDELLAILKERPNFFTLSIYSRHGIGLTETPSRSPN